MSFNWATLRRTKGSITCKNSTFRKKNRGQGHLLCKGERFRTGPAIFGDTRVVFDGTFGACATRGVNMVKFQSPQVRGGNASPGIDEKGPRARNIEEFGRKNIAGTQASPADHRGNHAPHVIVLKNILPVHSADDGAVAFLEQPNGNIHKKVVDGGEANLVAYYSHRIARGASQTRSKASIKLRTAEPLVYLEPSLQSKATSERKIRQEKLYPLRARIGHCVPRSILREVNDTVVRSRGRETDSTIRCSGELCVVRYPTVRRKTIVISSKRNFRTVDGDYQKLMVKIVI